MSVESCIPGGVPAALGSCAQPRREPLGRGTALFLGVFLVYAATSGGYLNNIDGEARYSSAVNLVRHGDPDVDMHYHGERFRRVSALSPDGRRYQVYNPGQTLIMAPFYLAGRGIAVLTGQDEVFAERMGEMLLSLVMFPLLAAGCALVFYLIQRDLGVGETAGALAAAALAFGTMLWEYSKFPAEETQVGLLLLLGLRHGLRWARGGDGRAAPGCRGDLAVFGAALGAAHLFRTSAAPAALVVGMAVMAEALRSGERSGRAKRALGLVLSGTAGALAAAAALGVYNWWRFGSPLETGYAASGLWVEKGAGAFDAPFAEGFLGLTLSPGKSVFLYNPALLAAFACLPALARRSKALAVAAPGALLAAVVFYSKYHFWHGDWAWGPRFLVSVLPIACLPLGFAAERMLSSRGWRTLVLAAILAASVLIQAMSVTFEFGAELRAKRDAGVPVEDYWSPWRSCLAQRFGTAAGYAGSLLGRNNAEPGSPLHFWPCFLARQRLTSAVPLAATAWCGMLIGAGALLRRALGKRAQLPPSGDPGAA